MTSVITAFWRRLDVPGHDAASVSQTARGYELFGQSVFLDSRGPAALRYVLALEPDWSTIEGHITGFIGERPVDAHIVRSPEGWTLNGTNYGMAGVVDLDLGFTPATNILQLKRTSLAVNEAAHFDVVWLEAGDEKLQRLPQEYRRISEFEYDYNSPTVDYHATIVLTPSGFAAVYPGLWEIVH
ncbi:putative glycolipid-binding domain-containing protein [Spirosoma arcticum]